MKKIYPAIAMALTLSLAAVSCGDPNDAFDMTSPQAQILNDTIEVNRGDVITLEAVLTDESGVASYSIAYDNWGVIGQASLAEIGNPTRYVFSHTITVPEDAALEWKENYQKHDGSIFNITQRYHKIALTFYDTVRNRNIVYFYIKVNG